MISFNYESDFTLENESQFESWIQQIIRSEHKSEGEINYIFCEYWRVKIRTRSIKHNKFKSLKIFTNDLNVMHLNCIGD